MKNDATTWPPSISFARFENRLESVGIRSRQAMPVVFHVYDVKQTWSFDAKRSGSLFVESAHPKPALKVTINSALLSRIITEPALQLEPHEVFWMEGDREAWRILARALKTPEGLAARKITSAGSPRLLR